MSPKKKPNSKTGFSSLATSTTPVTATMAVKMPPSSAMRNQPSTSLPDVERPGYRDAAPDGEQGGDAPDESPGGDGGHRGDKPLVDAGDERDGPAGDARHGVGGAHEQADDVHAKPLAEGGTEPRTV